MGLAHECHSIKTATGKLPTGYDESGIPVGGPWAQMIVILKKSPATEANEPHGTP